MPLKTAPDPANLGALQIAVGLPPETGTVIDVGDTSAPDGAAAPSYQVNYTPAGAQFTAHLVVMRAEQGNNTSIYLPEGVYETNSSLALKDMAKDRQRGELRSIASYLTAYKDAPVNRVYFYMPADIADLNRQAEREHCQDFLYAYQQTLAVFEAALLQAAPVTAASEGEAKDALVANVIGALPQGQRQLGADPQNWFDEFQRLCEKTRDRDANEWHSFGMESVDAAAVPGKDNPVYLTGRLRDLQTVPRVFLKFNSGASQIGRHTAAQVIV